MNRWTEVLNQRLSGGSEIDVVETKAFRRCWTGDLKCHDSILHHGRNEIRESLRTVEKVEQSLGAVRLWQRAMRRRRNQTKSPSLAANDERAHLKASSRQLFRLDLSGRWERLLGGGA